MSNTDIIINSPDLWADTIPSPDERSHKYTQGHALIYAAPEFTGATNLAAQSCARVGAGLVSVMAGHRGDLYRTILPPHIIVRDNLDWKDDRVTAQLYGSGGLMCTPDYKSKIPTILDADALSKLPVELAPNYILTPHEGEFAKTFPEIKGDKIENAKQAAQNINAIIVLKGAETIIAHPDSRLVLNNHSSPYLATAGTGDVLAGMITGFCAQGMEPFYAACAAVWIHGETGKKLGRSMVASDVPAKIPEIMNIFS